MISSTLMQLFYSFDQDTTVEKIGKLSLYKHVRGLSELASSKFTNRLVPSVSNGIVKQNETKGVVLKFRPTIPL